MRKFICSKFEIDLSAYKITDTAENPWFSGTYFTKYSFPFNIDISDGLNTAVGNILDYMSADTETLFEGIYVDGDVMEAAVLEVEECESSLSVTLRFGLDDFPNFTKKLAELPLQQQEVENIYEHAALVITQGWPAVNYNFPQVHIDKIDPEDSDVWFAFEKIINNYKAGAFLENYVDLEEEITYNRNIIQPLPYLLYLLQAGFADAGFTLMGDVLANSDIQKSLIYADVEYYTSIAQENIDVIVMSDEYDTIIYDGNSYPHITFSRQINIEHPGKYRITGHGLLRLRTGGIYVSWKIKYRNTVLVSVQKQYWYVSTLEFDVDVTFETLVDLDPNFITLEFDMGFKADDIVFDLAINPVRLHDDSGEAVPSILNLNQVDLKRAVPEMTFGDLVKDVLARYNMDLTPKGNEIWMNYISTEITTRPVKDLSHKEKKFPKRIFSKGNSYLMKYDDVDSTDYTWASVFQDNNGYSTSGFTKTDKTTEIIFKSLPLPLLLRNTVQTVHAFFQDNSKPLYVQYDGLLAGLNVCINPGALQVPTLHLQYHNAWLSAIINSTSYQWTFLEWTERLYGLTAKSRVHAYGNIHLVKSLQKTEVRPDLYEVELTTIVL